MNDFYYTPNPNVRHEKKEWKFTLCNNTLRFITDNGVFSKHRVDYGSIALINNTDVKQMPEGKILDMGCGYGPIGLFLAKQNPDRDFVMVDVNNLALSLAKENAEINHISNVDIFNSNEYENLTGKFAGIVTNPPVRAGKKVVDGMIKNAINYLEKSGSLNVVLQKKQGAPSAKKLMKDIFGNVEIIARDKGYYVLRSIKD